MNTTDIATTFPDAVSAYNYVGGEEDLADYDRVWEFGLAYAPGFESIPAGSQWQGPWCLWWAWDYNPPGPPANQYLRSFGPQVGNDEAVQLRTWVGNDDEVSVAATIPGVLDWQTTFPYDGVLAKNDKRVRRVTSLCPPDPRDPQALEHWYVDWEAVQASREAVGGWTDFTGRIVQGEDYGTAVCYGSEGEYTNDNFYFMSPSCFPIVP